MMTMWGLVLISKYREMKRYGIKSVRHLKCSSVSLQIQFTQKTFRRILIYFLLSQGIKARVDGKRNFWLLLIFILNNERVGVNSVRIY